MPLAHTHKILIVDDDESVRLAMRRTLRDLDSDVITVPDAATGLELIRNAASAFSLIISDQMMPGICGTEFLEQVRQISPHSIRYLITAFTRMDTIVDAVNKGAVQRFISKPWNAEDFIGAVTEGLALYEHHLENEHLFELAKKQSARLYHLNRELISLTTTHNKILSTLDTEIGMMKDKFREHQPDRDLCIEMLLGIVSDTAPDPVPDPGAHLNHLYTRTLLSLARDMYNLASRNGLVLPDLLA